jgi:hypothetical protein
VTDEESKRIILSRRARFVAAALASAGLAAGPACGGEVDDGKSGAGGQTRDASRDRRDEPQVCLSPPGGFGGVGGFGGTSGAGGAPVDASSEPTVCLSIGIDAQAEPQPCLEPPIDADSDAPPQPCLSPP